MKEIVCTSIVSANQDRILLKSKNSVVEIVLSECAREYAEEVGDKTSKCVALRDITKLSFVIYTKQRIKLVFKRCLWNKSAIKRFTELQNAIERLGYSSYDLT